MLYEKGGFGCIPEKYQTMLACTVNTKGQYSARLGTSLPDHSFDWYTKWIFTKP